MSELKVIDLGDIRKCIENNKPVYYEYYAKSEADKVIAHNKYKRCLAMANTLTWEHNYLVDFVSSDFPNVRFKRKHRIKWIKKWLALAEKFKDGK